MSSCDARRLRPLLRVLRRLRGWPLLAVLGRPVRRFHPQLQRTVRIPGGQWPVDLGQELALALWELA